MRTLKLLIGKMVTVEFDMLTNEDEGVYRRAEYGKLVAVDRIGITFEDGKRYRWISFDVIVGVEEGNHLDVMRVEVPK